MSDQEAVVDAATRDAGLPGATLKQVRKERGLSVAEVAEQLHLTESAIRSLERDQYDDLPGVTFVRGYIRSYAKLLGLDADALAAQYGHATVSEPVRALPDLGRTMARSKSRGRLLVTLLLFVLLAVLIGGYFWWQEEQTRGAGGLQGGALAFKQVEIERVDGSLHVQSLDELDAYTAEMEVAEISLDSLVNEDASENAQPVEAATEQESEQLAEEAGSPAQDQGSAAQNTLAAEDTDESSVESASAVADAAHQLELSFTAECWIRITDGKGVELVSGVRKAGETLQLNGEAPFELHLGNASGVQLRFNGQPVDIHSSIRGNVARIKLG